MYGGSGKVYLGGEDDRVAVEEEGEGASEVERASKPPPGGDEEHPAAVGRELTEVGDRVAKRRRVGGHAVAHPAEVRQRSRVRPAGGGGVAELLRSSSTAAAAFVLGGEAGLLSYAFRRSDGCRQQKQPRRQNL